MTASRDQARIDALINILHHGVVPIHQTLAYYPPYWSSDYKYVRVCALPALYRLAAVLVLLPNPISIYAWSWVGDLSG